MLKIFKLNIIIISEFSIFLLSTLYWLKIQFSLDVLDVYLMDPESKFWQNLISMICMKTAAGGCCWAGHCTGTQSPHHLHKYTNTIELSTTKFDSALVESAFAILRIYYLNLRHYAKEAFKHGKL